LRQPQCASPERIYGKRGRGITTSGVGIDLYFLVWGGREKAPGAKVEGRELEPGFGLGGA